jgi:chromosome condensin MukBEF ATPase and DNA-binding subunit MukB
LDGRLRAAALEEVADLKYRAKVWELQDLKDNNAKLNLILEKQAELVELESFQREQKINFALNRDEIACLEKLLAELYEIAEPTRIDGYTDEQMFEANAANEFTHVVGREIQAEIIANGRPSPAKLHNAMSNPYTFKMLQSWGLIPQDVVLLAPNHDPLYITEQCNVSLPKPEV